MSPADVAMRKCCTTCVCIHEQTIFCVSTQLSAINGLIVSTWHRAGTGTLDRWPALNLRALHARSHLSVRCGLLGRALLARPNHLREILERHDANTVHESDRAKKKINPQHRIMWRQVWQLCRSDDFWKEGEFCTVRTFKGLLEDVVLVFCFFLSVASNCDSASVPQPGSHDPKTDHNTLRPSCMSCAS